MNCIQMISDVFTSFDWVVTPVKPDTSHPAADIIVGRGAHRYVVEIERPSEARSDRVIALLAKAILHVQRYVKDVVNAKPLAILCLRDATDVLVRKVIEFQKEYAPDVAVGLIIDDGRRYFLGEELEPLNKRDIARRPTTLTSAQVQPHNLFSDLNQWMLKLLLAPEIPDEMLRGPRAQYTGGTDLAQAAQVSIMSASRFLTSLKKEGFLADERVLRLVRREELFRRWQASLVRTPREASFKYLVPGDNSERLHKFLSRHQAYLGLFDAADAFGLGHVSGAIPHVYVPEIGKTSGSTPWKGIVPAREGETPNLILRQPLAPQSLMRGAVQRNNVYITDVLQTWLDVSEHPARGREQARVIEETVLGKLIRGST